jgi:hypothetical protein
VSDCDCPHHPFGCFGHPDSCKCTRTPDAEPWIEFGDGWAKIHYRRKITVQDRVNLRTALTSQERQDV